MTDFEKAIIKKAIYNCISLDSKAAYIKTLRPSTRVLLPHLVASKDKDEVFNIVWDSLLEKTTLPNY